MSSRPNIKSTDTSKPSSTPQASQDPKSQLLTFNMLLSRLEKKQPRLLTLEREPLVKMLHKNLQSDMVVWLFAYANQDFKVQFTVNNNFILIIFYELS